MHGDSADAATAQPMRDISSHFLGPKFCENRPRSNHSYFGAMLFYIASRKPSHEDFDRW